MLLTYPTTRLSLCAQVIDWCFCARVFSCPVGNACLVLFRFTGVCNGQVNLYTNRSFLCHQFCFNRCHIIVVGVSTFCIVMLQNITEHVLLSFFKMVVAVLWHSFCFITSKKALHYRVVPAISPSTHALGYLVFPQHLPILKTAVVTALV